MKWTKLHGEPVLAYQDADLDKIAGLLFEAQELWVRSGTDKGSCVVGAGIGVMYLPPRARKPREKIVLGCPFQSDGGGSVAVPLNFLALHGVAAFHVAGRMD